MVDFIAVKPGTYWKKNKHGTDVYFKASKFRFADKSSDV